MAPRIRRRITTAKRDEIERQEKEISQAIVRPFEILAGMPVSYNPPPTGHYNDVLKHPLTVKDTGVLYKSLIKSRNNYIFNAPMFKLHWMKLTAHAKKIQQQHVERNQNVINAHTIEERQPTLDSSVSARDVMVKLCDAYMELGPHTFGIRIFIAKDERSDKKEREIKKDSSEEIHTNSTQVNSQHPEDKQGHSVNKERGSSNSTPEPTSSVSQQQQQPQNSHISLQEPESIVRSSETNKTSNDIEMKDFNPSCIDSKPTTNPTNVTSTPEEAKNNDANTNNLSEQDKSDDQRELKESAQSSKPTESHSNETEPRYHKSNDSGLLENNENTLKQSNTSLSNNSKGNTNINENQNITHNKSVLANTNSPQVAGASDMNKSLECNKVSMPVKGNVGVNNDVETAKNFALPTNGAISSTEQDSMNNNPEKSMNESINKLASPKATGELKPFNTSGLCSEKTTEKVETSMAEPLSRTSGETPLTTTKIQPISCEKASDTGPASIINQEPTAVGGCGSATTIDKKPVIKDQASIDSNGKQNNGTDGKTPSDTSATISRSISKKVPSSTEGSSMSSDQALNQTSEKTPMNDSESHCGSLPDKSKQPTESIDTTSQNSIPQGAPQGAPQGVPQGPAQGAPPGPAQAPQGSVPQGPVPQGPVPQGPVPQGAPQGSVPQEAVPQGAVPQGAPQGAAPQGAPPGPAQGPAQGSVPQGPVPQGAAPQGAPPGPAQGPAQGSVPQGPVPQGAVPQGAPQGAAPQGAPPGPAQGPAQGSVPQGSVPQGPVPQGPAPQGPAHQGPAPQGAPPGAPQGPVLQGPAKGPQAPGMAKSLPPRNDPHDMQSVENTIMIANLNAIARVDLSLNNLMKIVASGQATPQQIMRFQGYIKRAREMGPQPYHAHLLGNDHPLMRPAAKKEKRIYNTKKTAAKEIKLTAFQEKYTKDASLLFEFVDNPNVRYSFPKDIICEVISEPKPPVDDDDEQETDILVSFIWIHNIKEVEAYEKKLEEYNQAVKQREKDEEEKRKKEEEEAKKRAQEEEHLKKELESEKLDAATARTHRPRRKQAPPPKKSKPLKKLTPPTEPEYRYTTLSYTLRKIPGRYVPILVNSANNLESVQAKMKKILEKGTRMSNYYLWYEVDGKLDEKFAEDMRNDLIQDEKRMTGVVYTSSSALDAVAEKKRKAKEEKEEKQRLKKLRKLEAMRERSAQLNGPPRIVGYPSRVPVAVPQGHPQASLPQPIPGNHPQSSISSNNNLQSSMELGIQQQSSNELPSQESNTGSGSAHQQTPIKDTSDIPQPNQVTNHSFESEIENSNDIKSSSEPIVKIEKPNVN